MTLKDFLPYAAIIAVFFILITYSNNRSNDVEAKLEQYKGRKQNILNVDSLRTAIEKHEIEMLNELIKHYDAELAKRDKKIEELTKKEYELEKKYSTINDALGELPNL